MSSHLTICDLLLEASSQKKRSGHRPAGVRQAFAQIWDRHIFERIGQVNLAAVTYGAGPYRSNMHLAQILPRPRLPPLPLTLAPAGLI